MHEAISRFDLLAPKPLPDKELSDFGKILGKLRRRSAAELLPSLEAVDADIRKVLGEMAAEYGLPPPPDFSQTRTEIIPKHLWYGRTGENGGGHYLPNAHRAELLVDTEYLSDALYEGFCWYVFIHENVHARVVSFGPLAIMEGITEHITTRIRRQIGFGGMLSQTDPRNLSRDVIETACREAGYHPLEIPVNTDDLLLVGKLPMTETANPNGAFVPKRYVPYTRAIDALRFHRPQVFHTVMKLYFAGMGHKVRAYLRSELGEETVKLLDTRLKPTGTAGTRKDLAKIGRAIGRIEAHGT